MKEINLESGLKLKFKKLKGEQQKKLLDALERAIKEYPEKWNIRGYSILKATIKEGQEINNPELLTRYVGTPILKDINKVGYEHTLNLFNSDIGLVVEIPKHTMYSAGISFSSYKI